MPETGSTLVEVDEAIKTTPPHHIGLEAPARWVEILEATVLALVAISTAWSGFQAAKWAGLSTQALSLGLRNSVLAQEKTILAGQDRLYDVFVFNDWVNAKLSRNERLAAMYERRFRPEYATVFGVWLKLDPFRKNSSAPPGPVFMKEYSNANAQESAKLNEEAARFFEKGVGLRQTSEEYVRVTVFLATVLLLTAIGQRVRSLLPRAGIAATAFILLAVSAYRLFTLPHVW